MPRSARANYHHSYGNGRTRGCSRCGTVGAILLAVLGLPLVIYNAPACFFGDSFQDEYYQQREDRLVAHNQTTQAWKAEGRRRCLDHLFAGGSMGRALYVRITVAEVAAGSFTVVSTHPLVPLTNGDMIPDTFEDLEEERIHIRGCSTVSGRRNRCARASAGDDVNVAPNARRWRSGGAKPI